MPMNGHDYTYGATKNEPDAATVGLQFRPHPPRFFANKYGTTKIHADVSTVLLPIMPMHHNLINWGES